MTKDIARIVEHTGEVDTGAGKLLLIVFWPIQVSPLPG